MFRTASLKVLPVLRPACRVSLRDASRRNLWDLRPSTNIRSLMREMERFERDIFGRLPLANIGPRFIPVEGSEPVPYRVNIDVSGFKPEEIKLALKDRVLTIQAKTDQTLKDGGRFSQELLREITLPENVKESELKSFLVQDGILSIEAPFQPEEKPKEIPVGKTE